MKINCQFLLFASILGMALSGNAAKPLVLHKLRLQAIQQYLHLHNNLINHTHKVKQSSPIPVNFLKLIRRHQDKNKISHIRLQQQYYGFDVFGGYAIIHGKTSANTLLPDQAAAKMTGIVYEDLEKELGKPQASFTANALHALKQFKAQFPDTITSEEEMQPLVYLDDEKHAHWAYKVSFLIEHDDRIPERPTAIVDAATYEVWQQWNDLKTLREPAKGIGYGGNPKTGEIIYGKDYPYLEISRDKALGSCFMENDEVKVIDMKHRYTAPSKPMEFLCLDNTVSTELFWTGYNNDGYDKENGAFSPSNDALYFGYIIKHMYSEWYNVQALKKINGSPMQLVMRVHYGNDYENAFWDGKQMTFGDGESRIYPLVSLGISTHEVSHGFTEQHSDLEYFGQSGAMNEAFSDMAAQAAEFYATGINRWKIGAEVLKYFHENDAIRYLDTPCRDGKSIDRADDYYGGLDVHYASGVYNRLFYLLATSTGWDTRKAFAVMVKANMDYWTPYSNFVEGSCGIISAARDLGYSTDTVKSCLTKVAIKYNFCN